MTQQTIQQTVWSLNQETNSSFSLLGMAKFTDTPFTYREGGKEIRPVSKQSAWAQSFLPHLFIGNVYALYGHYDIEFEYPKYDLIIDLSEFSQSHSFIQRADYHYLIPVEDNGKNFPEILEHIRSQDLFGKINKAREENKKVLINCHMGMSRSATVAILYLMETYQVSLIQAYHHLQKIRPIVEPNPGYFSALYYHEKTISIIKAPWIAAELWLKEFFKNQNELKIVEKDNQVFLQGQREGSDFGYGFIALVSFLEMLNISFTLQNCDSQEGDIQVSLEEYQKLVDLKNKTFINS